MEVVTAQQSSPAQFHYPGDAPFWELTVITPSTEPVKKPGDYFPQGEHAVLRLLDWRKLYRGLLTPFGHTYRVTRFRLFATLNPVGGDLHVDYTIEQQRDLQKAREQEQAWREEDEPSLRRLREKTERDMGYVPDPEQEGRRFMANAIAKESGQRDIQNKAVEYLLQDPGLVVKSSWGDLVNGPYEMQSRWPGRHDAAAEIAGVPEPVLEPRLALTGDDILAAQRTAAELVPHAKTEIPSAVAKEQLQLRDTRPSGGRRREGRPRIPEEEIEELVHLRKHCSPKWRIPALVDRFINDPNLSDPEGTISQRLTRATKVPLEECPRCIAGDYPLPPES